MISHRGLTVEWLGYATVRLETAVGTVVYLDPGRYRVLAGSGPADDADLVCVTHDHHYDTDAIRRVAGDDATLVLFEGVNPHRIDRDVARPVDLPVSVRRVDDEADAAVGDVVVRTVPAFNHDDGPHVDVDGEPHHPRGFGCGFHLTLPGSDGDVRVFWPGDTDVLDGHAALDVSLFLPPIGGTFTMDRHGAASLAARMGPDLVVPVHYDTFDAIAADASAFAADLAEEGVAVALEDNSE